MSRTHFGETERANGPFVLSQIARFKRRADIFCTALNFSSLRINECVIFAENTSNCHHPASKGIHKLRGQRKMFPDYTVPFLADHFLNSSIPLSYQLVAS